MDTDKIFDFIQVFLMIGIAVLSVSIQLMNELSKKKVG